MPQDAQQIRVFGGGNLHIAAYGTDLPTAPDGVLDSAFHDVGFVTRDGFSLNSGSEVENVDSHQSALPTRKLVVSRSYAVAAQLQQQDSINYAAAFGGGDFTEPTPGVYRYDPPADTDSLPEYSLVLDSFDGDIQQRVVVLRATIEGEVETTHVRNGAALLPITFTALTPDDADRPWYFLTNDANFDPAGS